MRIHVALLVACLVPGWAIAGSARPTTVDPESVTFAAGDGGADAAIHVDGRLDEPAWAHAAPLTQFRQREPNEGADSSVATEVRVVFDANALYVGVVAAEPDPSKIAGHLTRRDAGSPSDWIRVVVDSFHDRRTAFEFALNPVGVKRDRYWFNDGQEDDGWDAVWDGASFRTHDGWQAEFRIPFSQLRFSPAHDGRIGFAVFRHVQHLNEVAGWPLVARSRSGFVSQFGEISNVRPGAAPRRLELVPYGVSSLASNPSATVNEFVDRRDPSAALGLDLKYALSPGLTLTATVNPDFGQVEADPAVVNLTAFETFFPERRPFFLEGAGTLQFDLDCDDGSCSGLFYSRRIGRTPQAGVDDESATAIAAPQQTTILGATKVTGRVGGFSVGAMNAITTAEDAHVAVGPLTRTQTVEPLTSYSLVRARREFANQSSIGLMATATNRRLDDDTRARLSGSAYTGGVDVDWRLSKRVRLAAYVAGSSVQGSADAIALLQESSRHTYQRPDADHVSYDAARTSMRGHAGMLAVEKHGGERFRFRTGLDYKSPGFEINDLGFMRRADEASQITWLQWRFDRPNRIKRTFRVNLNQWNGFNLDGDRLYSGGNVNAQLTFANNWSTSMGLNANAQGFDDRLTRGGPGGYRPPRFNAWYYVESDDRKPVSVEWFGSMSADRHGSRSIRASPHVMFRPNSALTIGPGLRLSRSRDMQQWIEALEDTRTHYVFGRLDQTTLAMTLRVNYTLSPRLSLQSYAEPFTSTGRYSGFKELHDGRAPYAERYAAFAYGGNPDFRYNSFRTTNVLRWEYRPGSTLYVVWQQGRERSDERSDYSTRHNVGDVFTAPARNVFLVKLAHWFNM